MLIEINSKHYSFFALCPPPHSLPFLFLTSSISITHVTMVYFSATTCLKVLFSLCINKTLLFLFLNLTHSSGCNFFSFKELNITSKKLIQKLKSVWHSIMSWMEPFHRLGARRDLVKSSPPPCNRQEVS